MQILLSPAKSLDFIQPAPTAHYTEARLLSESAQLIQQLQQLQATEISQLMGVSEKIATLNLERFHAWHTPFTPQNAKQAIFAFNGEVYAGLAAAHLSPASLTYLQKNLRILSGLYGVLRPLDLIQPYRLEMGTRLNTSQGAHLYAFWGNKLTELLNQDSLEHNHTYLINLASEEYFKSIVVKSLVLPVITPIFQDEKNGEYKVISFYAKRARGLMARFLAENQADAVEALLDFSLEGYTYAPEKSTPNKPLFRRASHWQTQ